MQTPKGFITLKEAQILLGYSSLKSVYNLIDQGQLTKYKIGRLSFLKKDEVINLTIPQPVST